MEIHYSVHKNTGIKSFLQNPEYSSYYLETIREFSDCFPELGVLNVDLEESFRTTSDFSQGKPSELTGNKEYNVTIKFSTYPNGKGAVRYPNVRSVLQTIIFSLKDEVRRYIEVRNKRFPLLKERLKQIGVDVSTNKDVQANELKASLALAGHDLDFEKRIWDLTADDLYQLGQILVISGTKGKVFTREGIISATSEMLRVKS